MLLVELTAEEVVILVTMGTMTVIGTGVGNGDRHTGEMPVTVGAAFMVRLATIAGQVLGSWSLALGI